MPRDRVADARTALSGQLGPGERVIAAVKLTLTPGSGQLRDDARGERIDRVADAVKRSSPVPRSRSLPGRLFGGAAELAGDFLTNSSPLRATFPKLPDPNGIGLSGFPGCAAQTVRDLLSARESRLVAVTTQRVVVIDDPAGDPARHRAEAAGQPSPPFRVRGELPAPSLASARRRPVGVLRSRMELEFGDGSMLAVLAGRAPIADAFAAALTAGSTD